MHADQKKKTQNNDIVFVVYYWNTFSAEESTSEKMFCKKKSARFQVILALVIICMRAAAAALLRCSITLFPYRFHIGLPTRVFLLLLVLLFFSFFFFYHRGRGWEIYEGAKSSIHQPDRSGGLGAAHSARVYYFHGYVVNIAWFAQWATRSPVARLLSEINIYKRDSARAMFHGSRNTARTESYLRVYRVIIVGMLALSESASSSIATAWYKNSSRIIDLVLLSAWKKPLGWKTKVCILYCHMVGTTIIILNQY